MATRIYNEKFVSLQDGTEVRLRPLPIGPLRRFMQAWKGFEDADDEDDGFDVFINCSGIALEDDFKGKFDALKASESEAKKGAVLSPEYKSYLESVLELDTIYEILDVCGQIKLNFDPKVMEAAAEVATAAEEVGKNSTSPA